MADRYTYIPFIGLFVAIAWSVSEIPGRWPATRGWVGGFGAAALGACAVLSWEQVSYWKDSASLFTRAVAVTHDNAVAQNNLGVSLFTRGDVAAAEPHFAEALRIRPSYVESLVNLGLCREKQGSAQEAAELFQKAVALRESSAAHYNLANLFSKHGRLDEAETHYRAALRLKPRYVEAWYNLGILKAKQGQTDEAAQDYAMALRLKPDYAEAHLSLGALMAGQQKLDEAIAHFQAALKASPNYADAHFNLAAAWNAKGDFVQATAHFAEACRLRPEDMEARENFGLALFWQGRAREAAPVFEQVLRVRPGARAHYYLGLILDGQGRGLEAVSHYREAVRLEPKAPVYLNDLAWILATHPKDEVRNGTDAVRLAEQACQLSGGKEARFWGTLDAAYAEVGQFDKAMATATKARELALASGQKSVAQKAEERLVLYRAGKPYRSPASP
ncbi:MAG: hypothetical protein DME25_07710 [Verrucomicrobia bacterium]|nr:MAG: hypothetical protein DME25_07710 [Verrucomicrobiota bacterium]